MEKKILVYNNHTCVAERMSPFFAGEGLYMVVAEDAEKLERILAEENISLMLVDVELGDKGWDTGIRLIARLRDQSRIPLIVVSEQTAETAKIMALEAGADDYVTEDCNPLELLARVQSQLRRYLQLKNLSNPAPVYKVKGLVIDDGQKSVSVDGRAVRLTSTEYKILKFLVEQRGKVFSNKEIYQNIWRMKAVGADNTIAVHVRHIREKIEEDPKEPHYLEVVWGIGYVVR